MKSLACLVIFAALALAQPPEFDTSTSELRPLIEAFAADRGNLQRTYNIEASPARQARMKKFYTDARPGAILYGPGKAAK